VGSYWCKGVEGEVYVFVAAGGGAVRYYVFSFYIPSVLPEMQEVDTGSIDCQVSRSATSSNVLGVIDGSWIFCPGPAQLSILPSHAESAALKLQQ
jgi:hypothetical protein